MINEQEKNKLTETEMDSVAGGYGPAVPDGVLINSEDRRVWNTFTWAQKQEVASQPDRASMRAKMIEIYLSATATPTASATTVVPEVVGNTVKPHGGGVSGGW